MSSSSDDSDNETLQQIVESTDSSLLTDSLYQKLSKPNDVVKNYLIVKRNTSKSQRYLENEETFDTDIKVSKSMQDHIGKKLSEIIASKIEFVDKTEQSRQDCNAEKTLKCKKLKSGVKLLKDFDVPIKYYEEEQLCALLKGPEKKPEIKRRIVEPENFTEKQKVEVSALDPCILLAQKDIKHWAKPREKQEKIFRYKTSKTGGTLHFKEPENEFTKLKKKNCWSEKKISTWKRK